MEKREDIFWLLDRIKSVQVRWGRSGKKEIFQGSYDVWESRDDGPKYSQIMNDRLSESKELGLIIRDSEDTNIWRGNWKLTEAGEEYLRNYSSPQP